MDSYMNRKKKGISPSRLKEAADLTAEFYTFMSNMYGNSFTNKNNNPDTQKLWGSILMHLSNEEIAYGLDKLELEYTDFPPNPFQFKKISKSGGSNYQLEKFSDMKPLT